MLQSVELVNFKCFQRQTVALGRLTILAGLNGMGKSSVIQALLALRQSALQGMLGSSGGLLLNGSYIRLGTALDVVSEFATGDFVEISVTQDGHESRWRFDYPLDMRMSEVMRFSDARSVPTVYFERFPDVRVVHIGAERIGPRETYDVSEFEVKQLRHMRSDGALAVAYLEANSERSVPEGVRHPAAAGPGLAAQVTAWMGEVSPGVSLVTAISAEMRRASLGVGFVQDNVATRSYRPTNVGFGLAYTLPMVIALLTWDSGDLVILENPEAHIHPRGQFAFGELMSRAAHAGAQVLVETHSDHVLNGVRVAVKRELIDPEDVRIHYFSRRAHEGAITHQVDSPRIDSDGRLDFWPDGFFDQWDLALEKLLEP